MTEGEALSAIRGNDPALAAKAETALWQVWCRSGIREVDLLLRQGIEAIERQEPEEALIDECLAGVNSVGFRITRAELPKKRAALRSQRCFVEEIERRAELSCQIRRGAAADG